MCKRSAHHVKAFIGRSGGLLCHMRRHRRRGARRRGRFTNGDVEEAKHSDVVHVRFSLNHACLFVGGQLRRKSMVALAEANARNDVPLPQTRNSVHDKRVSIALGDMVPPTCTRARCARV